MTVATVETAVQDRLRSEDSVKRTKFEHDLDSTGEDAVWIYVTLARGAADLATRDRIRHALREALADMAGDDESRPMVYVRFRGEGER